MEAKQRLLLVDVDVKRGKGGKRSIEAWSKELGIDFTEYLVQETPSGGSHYLFRVPDGHDGPLPNGADVAPGVDVLTDGKQFVVSPSVTEKGQYALLGSGDVVLPPVAELPEAPKQLLDHLAALGGEARGPGAESWSRLALATPQVRIGSKGSATEDAAGVGRLENAPNHPHVLPARGRG